MKIFHSHPWNISLDEAKKIQDKLSKFVIKKDDFEEIKTIGGIGIAFEASSLAISLAKFTYPDLKKLESISEVYPLSFPYAPNFFAFSCGQQILSLLQRVKVPDLLIFPGKGVAHPRRLGLASHVGVLLKLPTIACSKKALSRDYAEPENSKGSVKYLFDGNDKTGIALRSKDFTKTVFVSPGNKISFTSALNIILHCCTRFRLPEPLRQAQILARKQLRKP